MNTTATLWKTLLESALWLKKPHVPLPNTTLNQKLGVSHEEALAATDTPAARYVVLGNGGIQTMGTYQGTTPTPHSPLDAGLYQEIPLFIHEVGEEGISPLALNRYRLRRPLNIGSLSYYAYYAFVLDVTNITTSVQIRTINADGSVTSVPYTPPAQNLAPTPPPLPSVGTPETVPSSFASASTLITFTLNSDDVENIVEACELVFGDRAAAVISEFAYCAGVDRILGAEARTEAIGVQVMNFTTLKYDLNEHPNGFTRQIDIGYSHPLY